MQGMSFGPADLAANRRMKTTRVGGGHPGYRVIEDPDPDDPEAPRATAQQDPWHYSIARMVDACAGAGILPFYGPYGDIKDVQGCETQFRAAFLLGCVGAWSLHPAQIDIAKKVFSPDPDEVKFAKKVIEAIPDGRGVHMIDGKMQDDATWKQCKVMVDLAEMLARKDPELAEAYGLEPRSTRRPGGAPRPQTRVPRRHALLRVRGPRDRQAGRDPGDRLRVRDHRPGGARDRAPDRRPDRDQVAGADRRPHEGRRREVRRQRRPGGRLRQGDPEARDRRSHAARRAGGSEGRGQAGVLRRRRLGRPPQAAGDDLLAGRRHRHRAGGRGAAGQGRPPPLLDDRALQRLHGEGGRRVHRRRPAARSPASRPSCRGSRSCSSSTT